ncbi:uncharacterized protein Z518_01681 [Rhinocladiella mackenziei CBS 650.93]|uniref:LRR-containing protein second PH domain-containing protein n=1 Tax=Rhinocladiella mackenziei CBS 650.93 TaxID=1442369 RepID=A0A0D2G6L2_9EURO|nr:uncharacterized protein Z518_01681 [Rhinocladiella mackenziei CBS 650.93]KIX10597.1 hypothetical protein Z518_01681 [Rhinocladiella mackenziei CBS 650.93]
MADKRRRKSLSIFRQKANPSPSIQIPDSPLGKRPNDIQTPSPVDSEQPSPKTRPRTLQKANRTSVFGSLRSLHSLDEEEKTALTRSDSKASSLHDEAEMNAKGLFGCKVLQYGEVQAAGANVFRKRTHFMVLTESHLIRFRSQAKAVEMFPSIPSSLNRGHAPRTSSVSSYQELQMAAYSDITSGIPLEQVIAVYKIDDGRPFLVVEVAYLDERTRKASMMQLQVNEVREAGLWISAIRSASRQARSLLPRQVQEQTIEHLAQVLERERDYDPEHFHVFKIVQRSASRSVGRASAEDLTRLGSAICYLAIGLHRVHLIPLQRSASRSSSTSLTDIDATTSFGIVTLASIKAQAEEDAFQLLFKPPTGQPYTAQLASCAADEIALWLRFSSEYLRPEWLRQPFLFDVPAELDDRMNPPNFPQEDHDCFDRTLIAYCAGYDVDPSRICYSVDYDCEDAPCFQLLAPATGTSYSALELLAVFRALRYNESFTSISFARINLSPLRHLYDTFGSDLDSLFTRSGHPTNIVGHQDLPLLGQEIRGLALKSRRLRRLDFSHSIPNKALADDEQPLDCGIMEALAPLCKKSLTNVDWIVLTGLRLAESDLNYLVDAASERKCHLRALEIGECGLSVHDIDVLLSALAVQESTVEVIDISGAQGRFSPELFQREIGAFSRIRRLNLTRVQKTSVPEPLVAPDALYAWRLEALHLSQTALNEQTVDSISTYLATSKSDILRELHVNQCGLTGRDLATFFQSMTRDSKQPRVMHVSANENRLKTGNTVLFKTIAQSYGPTSLSMRMMDFEKESHFRELIKALTINTSLRSLDISRASLPYDASVETCEALKEMFATNKTLEELDISGEQAHLDATRFGIGLNIALRGLEKNKTLKLLRIEYQSLGLQGANTLAEVLEKNETLLEIHCEHNDINLQSFTALVDALEKNHTLLYMSTMEHDRAKSMDKVRREIETMVRAENPKSSSKGGGSIKKTFTGSWMGKTHRPPIHEHRHRSSMSSTASFTNQDVAAVMNTLDEKWNVQVARMQKYLFRNYCRSQGVPWEDEGAVESGSRQSTTFGESMAQLLEQAQLDRTPTMANPSALDLIDEKLSDKGQLIFEMPED